MRQHNIRLSGETIPPNLRKLEEIKREKRRGGQGRSGGEETRGESERREYIRGRVEADGGKNTTLSELEI